MLVVVARIAWLITVLACSLQAAQNPLEIIAYVFPKDAMLQPSDIRAEKLTRINYAFANIQNGRIVEGFAHDAQNFAVLHGLKSRNPKLAVLVSVGGWTWSGRFSEMAATSSSRKIFIDSVVVFLARHQLDGLDIDWEYPGQPGIGNPFRPEDKQNYTALLRELRHRFTAEHRPWLLSVATGASDKFLAHTEMREVAGAVDTVNLMTYDYYEPDDDKITGHHAPLFANPADPKHISADQSVRAYLAAGVPANKLVLGVPFYGHAWAHVPATAGGLFQSGANANMPGDYRSLAPLLQSPSSPWVRHWDPQASVPFLYNAATKTFVSYEDPQSLLAKCSYVLKYHLAGIMFWDYESDDASGTLLETINRGLQVSAPR